MIFFRRFLDASADCLASRSPRCAFASFGGIFFGYDSGYINGVLASTEFIQAIAGRDATSISTSHTSLIVSILSAGTFFGALIAGDLADMLGRRPTIIAGCGIVSLAFLRSCFSRFSLTPFFRTVPRRCCHPNVRCQCPRHHRHRPSRRWFRSRIRLGHHHPLHVGNLPSQGPWSPRFGLPVLHHHR